MHLEAIPWNTYAASLAFWFMCASRVCETAAQLDCKRCFRCLSRACWQSSSAFCFVSGKTSACKSGFRVLSSSPCNVSPVQELSFLGCRFLHANSAEFGDRVMLWLHEMLAALAAFAVVCCLMYQLYFVCARATAVCAMHRVCALRAEVQSST